MTKLKRKGYLAIMLAVVLLFMSACSGGKKNPDDTGDPAELGTEPVTLTVYDSLLTDAEFEQYVKQPIGSLYPNITLERIVVQTNAPQDLEQMVISGNAPDVMLAAIFHYPSLDELGLIRDVTDLVNKYRVDLSRIEPSVMEHINLVGNGSIAALPLYRNIMATFYNKDLFDRFGMDYPRDGMTYDEILELARGMTRMDDGVQYYGAFFGGPNFQAKQIGLNYLDAGTDRSLVNQVPEFAQVFNLYVRLFGIPGMESLPPAMGQARTRFHSNRTLAILTDYTANFIRQSAENDVNWDVATMPVFAAYPDNHSIMDFHALYVSKVTSHPDEAFAVISALSTSKEVQMNLSRVGRVPAMIDNDIVEAFGADVFQGKNVNILRHTKVTVPPPSSKYEGNFSLVGSHYQNRLPDVLNQGKDINTALREAEELMNQAVAAEKAK